MMHKPRNLKMEKKLKLLMYPH